MGPRATAAHLREVLRYVIKTESCWVWVGPMLNSGYGQMRAEPSGVNTTAHRALYTLLVGPIPKGMHLHHTCHIKRCVNPAHLMVVTPKEHARYRLVPRFVVGGLAA